MEGRPSSSRAGLAIGSGLLVVLAALTAVLAGTGDDRTEARRPAATTTSLVTETVAPIPTSPTVSADSATLQRAGLVVIDGEEVVLVGFDGTELARGSRAGWYPAHPDRGVDIAPDGTIDDALAVDDPIPGCGPVYGRGGVRVAVCGSDQTEDEIRVFRTGSNSSHRVLSGPINPVGHWRYALPSADGRWVLAYWSGECEIPRAYLFPTGGGPGRAAFGEQFETTAIGWAPDGRAIVGLWPGACGASSDEPGIYLVDPGSGRRQRIHPGHAAVILTSVKGHFANRLELVMERALGELGLEECCSQPTHGGGDAETGFVFEGHEIFVDAVPHDELGPGLRPKPGELRFDCGTARYFLTDSGPAGSGSAYRPDAVLLRRAADRLATRLYCSPAAL